MTIPTDTMPIHPPVRRMRMRDVSAGQWLLLGEALVTLAAASAAITMLPFRRVVRLASRGSQSITRARSIHLDVEDVGWAVEAVAWRVPWRTVCFQKGLTLHLMLRRRGIASVLHYGVGMNDAGKLAAHVWIGAGGRIVMGGEVADRFRCLASYPERDA